MVMDRQDAEEWTQALEQTHSGNWRMTLLALKMGAPEALGLTLREWQERIGGYVRLAIEERREAVLELTSPEGENLTTREAAEVLGVGVGTVSRDRRSVPNGTEEPEPEPEIESEGPDPEPEFVPNGTEEPEQPALTLDEADPEGALRQVDTQYMRNFWNVLVRASRDITDVIEFDLARVVALSDQTNRLGLDNFNSQLEDVRSRISAELERTNDLRLVGGEDGPRGDSPGRGKSTRRRSESGRGDAL